MKNLFVKIKNWFSKEKTAIDKRAYTFVEKYITVSKDFARSEINELIQDARAEKSILTADAESMASELGVEKEKLTAILTKYVKGFKVTL